MAVEIKTSPLYRESLTNGNMFFTKKKGRKEDKQKGKEIKIRFCLFALKDRRRKTES